MRLPVGKVAIPHARTHLGSRVLIRSEQSLVYRKLYGASYFLYSPYPDKGTARIVSRAGYQDALEGKPSDLAIYVRSGRAFEKLNQIPQAIEKYKVETSVGVEKVTSIHRIGCFNRTLADAPELKGMFTPAHFCQARRVK